jgi:hypothetical protein
MPDMVDASSDKLNISRYHKNLQQHGIIRDERIVLQKRRSTPRRII